MKLDITRNSSALVILMVGGIVAYALLVFLPLSNRIAEAEQSLELKRSIVAQEASLRAQIEQHQNEIDEVQTYTSSWADVPNPNFYLSQMLGEISHHAKRIGADSLRLEPGPFTEMQALHRAPVRLGCRGTFQEIHELLCHMESMPHQLWLHRIELAPGDEDRRELTCSMEFEAFIVSAKNSH